MWLGLWDIIGWSETVNYVFSLLVSLPTTGVDNYRKEFVSHVLHIITGALASNSNFNVVLLRTGLMASARKLKCYSKRRGRQAKLYGSAG